MNNNCESMQTVLVTGASSGIGLSICQWLLKQNYAVIGLARNFSKCAIDEAAFTAIPIDFTDSTPQLTAQLKKIMPPSQPLFGIICCAGYGQFGSLEEFSYQQINRLMQVNVMSQFYVIKTFLPRLKQQSKSHVIIMGSESALQGGRKGAVYSASKFALRGFTQALREECSRSGVHVCLINPGMVKTPFFDELDFSPGEDAANYLVPDDIAEVVALILAGRYGTVIDEINLSPLKKVIHFSQKNRH